MKARCTDWEGGRGDGGRWSGSGCILKVELKKLTSPDSINDYSCKHWFSHTEVCGSSILDFNG